MKNPDWVQFAGSMGVKGIKVSRFADLPAAMHDFLTYNGGPVLMEAVVDENEHVYPMVPGVTHARHTTLHATSLHARTSRSQPTSSPPQLTSPLVLAV